MQADFVVIFFYASAFLSNKKVLITSDSPSPLNVLFLIVKVAAHC